MKLFFSFVFALLAFTACTKPEKEVYIFTSHREPALDGLHYLYSYDGYHWDSIAGSWLKPEIGNKTPYYNYFTKQTEEQKYAPNSMMRDPSITQGPDGTFHLVWTTSWKGDLGFGYAQSKDLIHWSEQQMIPVMADEPTTVNVWAPEIFYDDEGEQFMVVWASCVPGRYEKGIEEEENNHRLYYITTKDFKAVSKAKVLYDPGFSSIDAVIVKRAKNDYVMVLKDNTRPERNLKIAFSGSMTGPYSPSSQPFTESFVEGPTVEKLGDDYLIYFDVYKKKIYGAMRTRDFRNFTDVTESVSVPVGHKHGTIFKASESVVKTLLEESKKK